MWLEQQQQPQNRRASSSTSSTSLRSSSTAASRGSFSSSSSGSYSSSSLASWSAATSTGPTCYGPRSTTQGVSLSGRFVGFGSGSRDTFDPAVQRAARLTPTSPESIHAILGGPCPSPQATSSTPSTPAAGPGPRPSRTRDMMSAIIPSITSHNHTPASYTTSPHSTSASSHHKKNFVPPSIQLNQFFASIESGASAPTPTPAPAAKAVGSGGRRGGGVAGLVGSTGNKFKGLAGGFAKSAKGKMAQSRIVQTKQAKTLNGQKVKAEKVASQAAQAEQAARRRQQQQVTCDVEYDSEDERYFNDEYDYEYDVDNDYSSSGDEGDSESEGSAPNNVGSASRSTDAQQPHPPHLAALSADTTYTFKPLPTLSQYKGSRESVDLDEDVVAHVEYATERDFVESTSARVTAHEKDLDHPAAKHAHQSRYSSDSEVEPDDRDRDDEYRGRSRRPRLLWRSQLAEPTVNVLDHYCREYYAMELPRLKNKGSPEGRKWSRQLDQAGL